MESEGVDKELFFEFQNPKKLGYISTLNKAVKRPLTEMLKSRFLFASKMVIFEYHFFSIEEIDNCLENEDLMDTHQAYKADWEGSAPNSFPDEKLSFFGSSLGFFGDPFYLVWKNDNEEPEVWIYMGQEEQRYPNIDIFFKEFIGGLMEECGVNWKLAE